MGQVHPSASIVVWERDGPSCSQCGSMFGVTCSRHHCRSCGDVVCGSCSPYLAYLPQLKYPEDESQRVCRTCASKSHRVVQHELAVATFLDDQALSQGFADDATLADVEDLFVKAAAMTAFNFYLMDRLRLQFAVIFSRSYALALTQLDAALRATYVGRVQLQNCITACERVRAVYLDHQDVFDPVDIQLLSDQIECARLRSRENSPVSRKPSRMPVLRPCMAQKQGSSARRKKVRFSMALPDFESACKQSGPDSPAFMPCVDVAKPAPLELDRIAAYANDVVCQ